MRRLFVDTNVDASVFLVVENKTRISELKGKSHLTEFDAKIQMLHHRNILDVFINILDVFLAEEICKKLLRTDPRLKDIEVRTIKTIFDSSNPRRDKDNCFAVPDEYTLDDIAESQAVKLYAECSRVKGVKRKHKDDCTPGFKLGGVEGDQNPDRLMSAEPSSPAKKQQDKNASLGAPQEKKLNGHEARRDKGKRKNTVYLGSAIVNTKHGNDKNFEKVRVADEALSEGDLEDPQSETQRLKNAKNRKRKKKRLSEKAMNAVDGDEVTIRMAPAELAIVSPHVAAALGASEDAVLAPVAEVGMLKSSKKEKNKKKKEKKRLRDERMKQQREVKAAADGGLGANAAADAGTVIPVPASDNKKNALDNIQTLKGAENTEEKDLGGEMGTQAASHVPATLPSPTPDEPADSEDAPGTNEPTSDAPSNDKSVSSDKKATSTSSDSGATSSGGGGAKSDAASGDNSAEQDEGGAVLSDLQPSGRFDNSEGMLTHLLRSIGNTKDTKSNVDELKAKVKNIAGEADAAAKAASTYQWQKSHIHYKSNALIKLCRVMVRDAINLDREARGESAFTTATAIYRDAGNRPDWWPLENFTGSAFEKKEDAVLVYNASRKVLAAVHSIHLDA